jgi:transcriptional regulator with XRE-family HTH domain
MQSRKKTTVAVLRLMLGLTVEEFAALIGKSTSAVTSLEAGRLALSEETAFKISQQTGVSLEWLLHGDAKQKPYTGPSSNGTTEPYTKEVFERLQARKLERDHRTMSEVRIVAGIATIGDWLSIYSHAVETGEGELVRYLMRDFLKKLNERFAKDDDAFFRANEKARLTTADGSNFKFVQDDDGCIFLWPADRSPSQ